MGDEIMGDFLDIQIPKESAISRTPDKTKLISRPQFRREVHQKLSICEKEVLKMTWGSRQWHFVIVI